MCQAGTDGGDGGRLPYARPALLRPDIPHLQVHWQALWGLGCLSFWCHILSVIRRVACTEHSQCGKQVQTEVMGDIHHYAWRARFRNQTVYINKRDSERFGDWASQQCSVSCALGSISCTFQHAWLANAL